MCGIAGLACRDGAAPDRAALERMTAALAHRGPDGSGFHVAGPVALGHRRLAIIDPAGGHQPIIDEASGAAITYNGELYNYVELRQELGAETFRTDSDTEVLLRAYLRWGPGVLSRLQGMFAFAIFNPAAQRLFIARDHVGIKPLYYLADAAGLAFASELSALEECGRVSAAVDPDAVDAYLRLGYVPAPLTIRPGARKLPPGHSLTFDLRTGSVTLDQWWRPEPGVRLRSEAEALEELEALLDDIIRIQVRSDVPFGVFLSGGVDSSLVAALMAARLGHGIHGYSVGFRETAYNELPFAAEAAKTIGIEHHSEMLEPDIEALPLDRLARRFGEPFADSSSIPTSLVSRVASREVKMVLSGDGGDELFAGYNSYPAVLAATRRSPAVKQLARLATPLTARAKRFGLDWRATHWSQREAFGACERSVLTGRDQTAGADPLAGETALDPVLRCQALDVATYLPDDVLAKVDRASMDHGLEVRVPLLDHRLVQFAMTLPLRLRLAPNGGGRVRTKALLKRAAEKYYPASFLDRPKWGFGIPIAAWARGPLASRIRDSLDTRAERLAPHLDPGAVRRVLAQFTAGRNDMIGKVWILFAFGLWMDEAKVA